PTIARKAAPQSPDLSCHGLTNRSERRPGCRSWRRLCRTPTRRSPRRRSDQSHGRGRRAVYTLLPPSQFACRPSMPSSWFSVDAPIPELREGRTRLETGAALVGKSLLPFAVLDHLLDLLLHCIEIERGRVLHRRIVDRRQRQLLDKLLDQDESPELAGV